MVWRVSDQPKRPRKRPDWFLIGIFLAAVIGLLLPARGVGVPIVDWAARIMIAGLFFVHGVRLKPAETIAGLKHWKLHSVTLSFTYLVFPLVGLGLRPLVGTVLTEDVYRGILFLCLVPSTVQSSINFTAIARGNVAGAIVSASISNLLGVFITPLLAIALMSTTGLFLDASSILDIAAQILAPFVLGQLSRPLTADFVARHPKLKLFDQASILMVVYKAFSQGAREGIWQTTGLLDIGMILVITCVMLAFFLWLTWAVAGWLGFNRRDQIAIQMCGTKKSLATGVPMAAVMFPAAQVGMIVLPLMLFHQVQLMVCGALAQRYAGKSEDWHQDGEATAA